MGKTRSQLDAKNAIDEMKASGLFNPAMEAYLKRKHPTLLGSSEFNEHLLEDIVKQDGSEATQKSQGRFSRFLKPFVAGASVILGSMAGAALDEDSVPRPAEPMLDVPAHQSGGYLNVDVDVDHAIDLSFAAADNKTWSTSEDGLVVGSNLENALVLEKAAFDSYGQAASSLTSDVSTDELYLLFAQNSIEVFFANSDNDPQYAGSIDLGPNVTSFGFATHQNLAEDIELGASSENYTNVSLLLQNRNENTDGKDIVSTWKIVNGRFAHLGETANQEEGSELLYGSEEIGARSTNYVTPNGIVIFSPKTNGGGDQVKVALPPELIEKPMYVIGPGDIGHGRGDISNLNLYVAHRYEEEDATNLGSMAVHDNNRLPGNAEFKVEYIEDKITTPQNNTEDAWVISPGNHSTRMGVYDGQFNQQWANGRNITIWVDSNQSNELVVALEDGTELERIPVGSSTNRELAYIVWNGQETTEIQLYQSLAGDAPRLIIDQDDYDAKSIVVGQGATFNAGSVTDLDVSVWAVDEVNNTVDIRIGDLTYITLGMFQTHHLTSEISLMATPLGPNEAQVVLQSEDYMRMSLGRNASHQFNGSIEDIDLNSDDIAQNSSRESSTRLKVFHRAESADPYGVDFILPRGDDRSPYGGAYGLELDGEDVVVPVDFSEDETNLSEAQLLVKTAGGEVLYSYNLSVSGDEHEGIYRIPVKALQMGNLTLETRVTDESGNSRVETHPFWLGKPDTDYSNLETLRHEHLLILHGTVKNALGEQSYTVSNEGDLVQEGTFNISEDGSVMEVIDLSGFLAGDYKINFQDTKTDGVVEYMTYAYTGALVGETRFIGDHEVTLLDSNDDNVTVRVRNTMNGSEETRVVNKSQESTWDHEYLQGMFNETKAEEIGDIRLAYSHQINWGEGPWAEMVISTKENVSVDGKAPGYPSSEYIIKDIINGNEVIMHEADLDTTWSEDYWQKQGRNWRSSAFIAVNESSVEELPNYLDFTLDDHVESDQNNYDDGYNDGYNDGHSDGYGDGHSDGHDEGYGEGNESGYQDGYGDGQQDGNETGYQDGYGDGLGDGYGDGYDEGYRDGNETGYEHGYENGSDDVPDEVIVVENVTNKTIIENITHNNTTVYNNEKELAEAQRLGMALGAGLLPATGFGYLIGRRRKQDPELRDRNGNSFKEISKYDDLFESDEEQEIYSDDNFDPDSYAEVEEMFDAPREPAHLSGKPIESWLKKQEKTRKKLLAKGYSTVEDLIREVGSHDSPYTFFKEELGLSEKASTGLGNKLTKYIERASNELDELFE